jgi:predicted NBD/HSP70 family sugar kinase
MSHILAVDVGGTTTSVGLLNTRTQCIDHCQTRPTEPGLTQFPLFFGQIIASEIAHAQRESWVVDPIVRLGLPGNFKPGESICPALGSAQQLLMPQEHFSDACITPWLTQHVPPGVLIYAVNDALAQAVGAMQALWCDDFKQKVMVYIGPGTGLGGAVLKLGSLSSEFEVITDGHIYDIMVTIQGHRVMAEDVLSGRGILARSGVSAVELSEHDDVWNRHLSIGDDCADVARQIIHQIQHQTVVKSSRSPQWPLSDMKKISPVGVVILGGSIGAKGRIGRHLAETLEMKCQVMVRQATHPMAHALNGAVWLSQHPLQAATL